jgi:hypothetical protein
MEDIKYEGLLGILSEINKKVEIIQTSSKSKENQQVKLIVSKEEIETIVKEKVTIVGNYIDLRLKQQTEQQTKTLAVAIKEVDEKLETLSQQERVSLEPILKLFPKLQKVSICGFEFLRSSVIIAILIAISFFSLVLNIKQMDDYRMLKARYIQQNEYIIQIQKAEKRNEKILK